METEAILNHFDKMTRIADMIIAESHRIQQLEKLREEKNWLFYTINEKREWIEKFSHKMAIHKMALDRLRTYYTNNSKLN